MELVQKGTILATVLLPLRLPRSSTARTGGALSHRDDAAFRIHLSRLTRVIHQFAYFGEIISQTQIHVRTYGDDVPLPNRAIVSELLSGAFSPPSASPVLVSNVANFHP